jgi:xanthine dehydrogenase accessory factor
MIIFDVLRQMIEAEQPVALATIVDGEQIGTKLLIRPAADAIGTLGDRQLDADVTIDALELLDRERSETRDYQTAVGTVSVLIEVYPPPHHLIIVGAVHTAIPLTTCAKQLGFRVTVIDPRAAFATPERFPDADQLVIEWPDEALPKLRLDRSTYVAVLTHDPKLDDPAVQIALSYPVRYVGAIGSPKTQAARKQTLRELGVSEESLQKIYGPIGLPIGGKTPAEIAVSIVAEMIAVRRGKSAAFRPSVST